ncbi:MAG: hypothetical protein HC805_08620 [Alkalinema sp. RL_2_19]|nr:hypothetical protein [Alkalinema sp. RL_2_19]
METVQHPAAEAVFTTMLYRSQLNHAIQAIKAHHWVQDESRELEVEFNEAVIAQAIVNVLASHLESMFADWSGEDWLRSPELGKALKDEIKSLADNPLVSELPIAA